MRMQSVVVSLAIFLPRMKESERERMISTDLGEHKSHFDQYFVLLLHYVYNFFMVNVSRAHVSPHTSIDWFIDCVAR